MSTNSRNFGTNALHGIVKEILSKCFEDPAMSTELGDGFVESVAKNNFEWYYVSKPHIKLPHADYRPLDSTFQGKCIRFVIKRCSATILLVDSLFPDLVDSGRVCFIQVT